MQHNGCIFPVLIDPVTHQKLKNALGLEAADDFIAKLCPMLRAKRDVFGEIAATDDLKAAADVLHTVISNAAALGALPLRDLAREIEQDCINGDIDAYRQKRGAFIALFNDTIAALALLYPEEN